MSLFAWVSSSLGCFFLTAGSRCAAELQDCRPREESRSFRLHGIVLDHCLCFSALPRVHERHVCLLCHRVLPTHGSLMWMMLRPLRLFGLLAPLIKLSSIQKQTQEARDPRNGSFEPNIPAAFLLPRNAVHCMSPLLCCVCSSCIHIHVPSSSLASCLSASLSGIIAASSRKTCTHMYLSVSLSLWCLSSLYQQRRRACRRRCKSRSRRSRPKRKHTPRVQTLRSRRMITPSHSPSLAHTLSIYLPFSRSVSHTHTHRSRSMHTLARRCASPGCHYID